MPDLSVVDLVGVGLNATDTLIPLDEFPARGSKVEFAPVPLMPGGQTASAIAACQAWGLATRYVGKLGDDDAARLHAHEFARLGVDARLIEVANAASPQSIIIVDGGGERTVLIRRDDRLQLTASDIERDWIVNARSLLVDGIEAEAATQAAKWAHEAGVPVIADLDEEYDGGDELLACVDYLIVSRDFPVHMTGEHDLARALRILRNKYNCKLTAATLGQDGVIAWDGERLLHRAAYRVSVVDTTGAGDIFHAGFIYGLLQGWPLERKLDYACAAAALNCTCSGARGGIRAVRDVEKLMAETPRYEIAIIP